MHVVLYIVRVWPLRIDVVAFANSAAVRLELVRSCLTHAIALPHRRWLRYTDTVVSTLYVVSAVTIAWPCGA